MQKKVKLKERDFFKEPFVRPDIEELLLGRSAAEMFSFKSPHFKSLGVKQDTLTDNKLIDYMLKEPRLIRRPIVKLGKKVYFGADIKVLEEII